MGESSEVTQIYNFLSSCQSGRPTEKSDRPWQFQVALRATVNTFTDLSVSLCTKTLFQKQTFLFAVFKELFLVKSVDV